MKPDYAVQLIWSEEDEAYLAITAELPGCIADGKTQEEALANVKVAIQEWIEVANEEGRAIPSPLNVQKRADMQMEEMNQLQRQIEIQVKIAIATLLEQLNKGQAVQTAWSPRGGMQSHQPAGVPGKQLR